MVSSRRKVLQISVPRGGSNAVARMVGQSPDIAAVLRSRMLEDGTDGFIAAAEQAGRQVPQRLLYVKEHGAFLTEERFGFFGPDDRFLVVVRDPAQQLASAVLAVLGNQPLLGRKLAERRGNEVTGPALGSFLDSYAAQAFPDGVGAGGGWQRMLTYVRATYDFGPVSALLTELYGQQPDQQACGCDVEWFDRALFHVAARSWLRAAELARQLEHWAERVAVVDFTVLQTRPGLVTQVCRQLGIRADPRMVTGPWQPAGQWFDAGLELADGHRWVDRARRSTVLRRPHSVPYDPLTLPPAARAALLPSLASYLSLLRHPAFLGPRTPEELKDLFGRGMWRWTGTGYQPDQAQRTFLTKNPVTAWCLAVAVSGVHSDVVRSVEAANPRLRKFFAAARQLCETSDGSQ